MTNIPKTEKLFLDDLAVGAEFHSGKYAVEAEEIREFAQHFNPQPFHLDEDVARKTLFEGVVASGWHTAAVTMRLFVHSVPLAGGIIGAAVRLLGQGQPDRATCLMLLVRSSISPLQNPIVVSRVAVRESVREWIQKDSGRYSRISFAAAA
jgi:hypothetical protein